VKNQVRRIVPVVLMVLLAGSGLSALGIPVGAGPSAAAVPGGPSPAVNAEPPGDGPWVVRAYYTDRRMVDELAAWLEPWEVHPDKGYLVVGVTRDQYERLLAAGFRLEVDAQLTEELTRPRKALPGQVNGIPGYPCYRTVEETYATAAAIVAAHPTLATWIDIGNSWEKETSGGNPGYDMMVLRLTNSAIPGPKPKLFAMTAIHAREYATAELATRFAEYLVDNYGVDADVTWLLDYHEIHLLLEANPDGRKIAETEPSPHWRKNTDNDDGCSSSDYWGTDLNRNYDFQWSCCGGSSGSPCAETYRGPSAASEPEAQAVQNYVLAQFPDQREDSLDSAAPADATGVFLDIHSYSQLVLWPWGFTSSTAPNATGLQTLGRKFAYYNHYTPQQSMDLYPTDGTTDDFAYGKQGVAAYCFEIGTSFYQDCATFENIILPNNLLALIYAAKVSRTPYLTPAGPDALSVAVAPGAIVPGTAVHLAATIDDTRYNNSNGTEPTQNIAAAEFYVDVPPWVTTTTPVALPMTAVDGSFNQKTEAVEATIDTGGLAKGRHIVFVRGQDAAGNWGAFSAVFLYVIDPDVAPVIEGYVRDAGNSSPLDATVTAGEFQTQTNPATGFYTMMVISGTYDVTASATGYASATASDVQAQDYQTVQQDLYLFAVCDAFADDVESGNQGWTAQSPWAITTEASHSPTHSWTESPGGDYASNRDVSLTSPVFDLSSYHGVSLGFWHIYDLEPGYDYGYVEYSTNGGSTWSQAASYTGYDHTTWARETIPLPALDGVANARIRFRFTSDGYLAADGWHIDDIALSGGGPACLPPSPPAPEFTTNSPVYLGEPMQFSNLTAGSIPLQYWWDFGDGAGTSTQRDPAYTYLRTGLFTVTLVATNTLGSDSISHPVVVECGSMSEVDLALVTTGPLYPGDIVKMNADVIPDRASKPYAYTVDYGDGTLPITATSSANPLLLDHAYASDSSYTVQIAAWNCGVDAAHPLTDTLEVHIVPRPPCAEVSGVVLTLVSTEPLYPGASVEFRADILPDGATKPYTYTLASGVPLTSTADPLTVVLSFSAPGSQTVEIAAWNCAMTVPVTGSLQVVVMPPPLRFYLPLITRS
jgi:carboxypeptidase T